MTTTLTIDDKLFAAAARAVNSADPSEVVARTLRLAAEDSIELYNRERIAEFERSEKDLEEFFRHKGLRLSQQNADLSGCKHPLLRSARTSNLEHLTSDIRSQITNRGAWITDHTHTSSNRTSNLP